jgi:hypothetical protein
MGPYFLPMLLSFVAGALGYVIYRYSIRPVYGYVRVRSDIKREIKSIESQLAGLQGQNGKSRPQKIALNKKRLNQVAVKLSAMYQNELPSWYRIMISGRGESPIDAANDIMTLGNMREADHIQNKVQQIRMALKLK